MSKQMGRPKIVWTDKQIKQFKNLCAMQCTIRECCSVMDCEDDTLQRIIDEQLFSDITGRNRKNGERVTFSDAFNKYSQPGKVSLRRCQFRAAEKGNPALLIWLGKQWLGQKDTVEHINADDKPVIIDDI